MACSTEAVAPAGAGLATPIEVAVARPPHLVGTWALPGDVRAVARAELAAQVAGRLEQVLVREGDHVSSGQLLARIDPSVARAAVASAEAALEQSDVEARVANSRLDRIGRVATGVVADAERTATKGSKEAAEAGVLSARANLQRVRAELAQHDVRAPWDGVIARRYVHPGDQAVVGRALLSLVSVDEIEVLVDGPPSLLGVVAAGDAVTLQDAPAHVVGIVPALDPVTRTVRLRITPDDPLGLVPGDTTTVTLAVTRDDGTAVVPRDAIVTDPGGSTVVRLTDEEGGHERLRVVLVATTDDDALVRAEGIAPGDRVVTRGNERLRPGQPIRIVSGPTAEAESP